MENQQKKKSSKKPLIIIAAILLGVIILGVSCNKVVNNVTNKIGWTSTSTGEMPNISGEYISVIYIEGVISAADSDYNHQFTLDSIEDSMYQEKNKGILLFIDTPGGGVYESDEIYLKIKEYKEKTGKPVYAVMGSMAASGGYYISAPCDTIFANRNTWTGSIGVTVGTFYDISGLLEKYGVKTVTITSGENKAMGSMVEPMSEEQQAIFQSLVDEAYLQFVEIVAEGRNLPVEKVKELADGRIYTGKQAEKLGLVDKIGTLEDAKANMQEEYSLENVEFYDYVPPQQSFIESLIYGINNASKGAGDIQGILELMNSKGEIPVAYITEWVK